jgi:hypothetical protein
MKVYTEQELKEYGERCIGRYIWSGEASPKGVELPVGHEVKFVNVYENQGLKIFSIEDFNSKSEAIESLSKEQDYYKETVAIIRNLK